MNIFYIETCPKAAAMSMVDRHVIKMIVESCQLLSTAHRVLDGIEYIDKSKLGRKIKRWKLLDAREYIVYTASFVNHPSAVWCRESVENYCWLSEHLYALLDEYTFRYEKKHKCFDLAYTLQSPPKNLEKYDWTDIPCAMAKEYIISEDSLINYRNYYINGKKHLHKYTKRQPPKWINNENKFSESTRIS